MFYPFRVTLRVAEHPPNKLAPGITYSSYKQSLSYQTLFISLLF